MPTLENTDDNSNRTTSAIRIQQIHRYESETGMYQNTLDTPTQEPLKPKKKKVKKDKDHKSGSSKNQRKLASRESTDVEAQKNPYENEIKKLKASYNLSVGKMLKDWMLVIYCVLVLRRNLLKCIFRKIPDHSDNETHIPSQIHMEGKMVYNMVRDAQKLSQERFVHLWMELRKLVDNRTILQKALESQSKESVQRDWKGADSKLSQLQEEYQQAQDFYKSIQKSKIENESTLQKNFIKLQNLANARNAEYKHLVEQITELKKKEVQMRGKILVNMKNYKDLKMKKQSLINVENEILNLKNGQNEQVKKYTAKIQSLKERIDEVERQTKMEKEERKKLKASLEGFGDFVEKRSLTSTEVN